ncbi:unnamed protein product [Acanthosepion pharaonis]|uniref:Uncharacterized protein n=1 Tax=Acanthosepion pharaonis TaxID=158019 RepID=A0A812BDY2_ACAPH|nr:unnamed protein product [Sepia pharaonis]
MILNPAIYQKVFFFLSSSFSHIYLSIYLSIYLLFATFFVMISITKINIKISETVLCLRLYFAPSLCLTLSVSLPLSLSLSLSLCLSIYFCLSVYIFLCLALSFFFLALSVFSLSLCLCLSRSLSLSLCLYLSFPLSFSVSLALSVYLSRSLSLDLYFCFSLALLLSLSLSLCLFFLSKLLFSLFFFSLLFPNFPFLKPFFFTPFFSFFTTLTFDFSHFKSPLFYHLSFTSLSGFIPAPLRLLSFFHSFFLPPPILISFSGHGNLSFFLYISIFLSIHLSLSLLLSFTLVLSFSHSFARFIARSCSAIQIFHISTFRTLSALYAPTTRELIRKHWQRSRYKFWGERCFCTTLRRAHNYKFDMVAKKNEHGGRKCKATKKDTITSGPF